MFFKYNNLVLASAIFFLSLICGCSAQPMNSGKTNVTQAQTPAWKQLFPAGEPPTTRYGHSAVYDATNNRMTIFGGRPHSNGDFLGDVWLFSDTNGLEETPTWKQIFPGGEPPPVRQHHTAVYDTANNQMIIFGGTNYDTRLNDVWVLSNANGRDKTPSTWTQLSPTGNVPEIRYAHTAVYDATNNRMIIFGGSNNNGSSGLLNDVWVLRNASGLGGTPAWIKLTPNPDPSNGLPAERYAHTAVYDADHNRMTIFGGWNGSSYLNDVWVLSNANGLGGTPAWTKLSPTGTGRLPSGRQLPTAVYDATNNRMIVFGGDNGSFLNDVWVLSHANGLGKTFAWTQIFPGGKPPAGRSVHTAVYDATKNRMTIFGGVTASDHSLNDVWVLDLKSK